MFNRFTQSLIKMDERSQLEFLRKMVEGVLSLDTVMRAGELGAVNQLLSHGDQIGVLDHIVDAIDLRANTLRGNAAGIDLVNQFQALSAKERAKQADTYIRQLQRLGKSGEHAHKQLMNILSKDSAIIVACNQLVAMFAYKLYCINDIDTSEQCEIINNLSENPECVIKSKHPSA